MGTLLASALLITALGTPSPQAGEGDEGRWRVVADTITLVELLEVCADELGVGIDYPPSLPTREVAIRSDAGVTTEGLWATANRALAEAGFACIQAPGEETLSVVPAASAVGLSRIEKGDVAATRAGFVKVVRPVGALGSTERLPELLRATLAPGQPVTVTALGDDHVLVAGLKAQVLEVLALLDLMSTSSPVVVEEVRTERLPARAVASLVEQVAQRAKSVDGEDALAGSVLPGAENHSLFIIAPQDVLPRWIELVQQLDQSETAITRSYLPTRFGLEETARTIEEVVHPGDVTDNEPWRMVLDKLTGTIVLTTTYSRHLEVQQLFEQLEAATGPGRRSLRSFAVKNRDVEELLDLLQGLLDAGAGVESGAAPAATDASSIVEAPTPTQARHVRPEEGLSLSADAATNRILAFGEHRFLDQVGRLIETLDVKHPQVLVETLVLGLTDSDMLDLGVELQAAATSGQTMMAFASLFGLSSPGLSDPTTPALTGAGGTGVVLRPGDYSALVRAVETVNQGRTLTVPKVLVTNHQAATLNSVLQTPFTATNATQSVATTTFGGTQDAGTSVVITPHITDGDRIRLEYSVSISSFVGEPPDPNLPPPRQENILESIAVLPDGFAIAVGGLEIETDSEAVTSVPLLGRIPILGWAFRNRSDTTTKSRFFVFIRCSVMRSDSFAKLREVSARVRERYDLPDGWPQLEPRIMR